MRLLSKILNGRMILMKKLVSVIFMLLFALSVSMPVSAEQINSSAVYMIDSDIANTGCQNKTDATSVGASQFVGFGIYVKNVDAIRSFNGDFTWDPALAAFSTKTSTLFEADSYTINGAAIDIPDEANILGEPSIGPGVVKENGHYYAAYAKMGGDEVKQTEYGLIYYFVLKTAATFTETSKFVVTSKVTLGWTTGGVASRYLGERYFYVYGSSTTDVKNSSWSSVKKQFKDF